MVPTQDAVAVRSGDGDLLQRVANGDQAAFTTLMTAHRERVLGLCLRIMRNREDAQDALQEVFITLYQKAGQFRGEAAVSTWLHRIAVNTCIDLLRHGRRRAAERLPDMLADTESATGFAAAEARLALEAALASLAPSFRVALTLTELEGLSTAEASRTLDVPEGTVKSRAHRARRELGRLLSDRAFSRAPS